MNRSMFKISLVSALASLSLLGCNSALKVPQPDMRASMDPSFFEEIKSTPAIGSEENDDSIRETVLNAVRASLLKTGRYPKKAIQNCELLSLKISNSMHAPANARWNYLATIRVNLDSASSQISQFNVFDRNGEFIVRKVSV